MRPVIVMLLHEEQDTGAYMIKYLITRGMDFVMFRCWEERVASLVPKAAGETIRCLPVANKPHHYVPCLVNSTAAPSTESESLVTTSTSLAPVSSNVAEDCRIRAVASFGGSMSVNDELSYFESIRSLMRSCLEKRIPIIGHCLGGQLLSSALGGRIVLSENIEVGWYEMVVEEAEDAKDWFGGRKRFDAFHIHTDSFTIPQGARRIVTGAYCANQAFQVGDQFALGMQFHPEVDEDKVRSLISSQFPTLYTEEELADILRKGAEGAKRPDGRLLVSPGSMTRECIEKCLREGRIEQNRPIADSIYDTWCSGFLF